MIQKILNCIKRNWLLAQKYQEEIYLFQQQLNQSKLKLITELKVIIFHITESFRFHSVIIVLF
jgi:hypothetical protein